MIRYITDDLEISSDDSDKESFFFQKSFLTKILKIVNSKKIIHESISCSLFHSTMFKAQSVGDSISISSNTSL